MAGVKKSVLGRGIDALIQDSAPITRPSESKAKASADSKDQVVYIKLSDISPNAAQPRKHFDEEKIMDLAKSIVEHGIIQPIVVRKKGEFFEIVAGERRWRAAHKANLTEVPCLIREFDDEQNMLIAIIENMQREDLNPVEEAEGLNQMVTTYKMTQEEVSKSVGKSRPYITNSLRLLRLPNYVKDAISEGKMSAAHGRTLVAVEDEAFRKELAERIINEELSVREVEKLVQSKGKAKKKPQNKVKDADLKKVEEELKDALGTRVNILQTGNKGKIEIEFFSKEERERLIDILRNVN